MPCPHLTPRLPPEAKMWHHRSGARRADPERTAEERDMKLEGIRVLDLSNFLPGPHLTTMMADHGAEVIKIENPREGEPTRKIGAVKAGQTVYFRNTQRGKQSLNLDLKAEEGREILLRLPPPGGRRRGAGRPRGGGRARA